MPPHQRNAKRTSREPSVAEFRASSAALFQQDELRKAKIARVSLDNVSVDSDDDAASPSPRYDLCLRAEGSNGVLKYTNFTLQEFDNLWGRIESYVVQHWNIGRGKKCSNSGKDVFFMSVSALKHCGKWDTVAHIFRILPATFQKMVRKFLAVVGPHLYEMFVTLLAEKATMSKLMLSGKTFKYFLCESHRLLQRKASPLRLYTAPLRRNQRPLPSLHEAMASPSSRPALPTRVPSDPPVFATPAPGHLNADQVRNACTAPNTKKAYRSYIKGIAAWIRETQESPDWFFEEDGNIDLSVFASSHFEKFLMYKMNGGALKVSTLSEYRSALKDIYRRKRLQLPPEYLDDLKTLFRGLKRVEADNDQAGRSRTSGKEPLTFSLYSQLTMITLKQDDSGFAHLFLRHKNLMCGSKSVETLHI